MFHRWLRRIGRKQTQLSPTARRAQFRLTYSRFREILTLNDGLLSLIAEFEEKGSGREPFALPPLLEKLRLAQLDVALIIKDLNQIARHPQYSGLYAALDRIRENVEAAIDRQTAALEGPLVLPFHEVRRESVALAGSKAAALGELRSALGLSVPDGFVVTTAAFYAMLRAAGQTRQAAGLETVLEKSGRASLVEACRDVRDAILSSAPPPEVLEAISVACDQAFGADPPPLAVRSSAVGEDTNASHAGQYLTRLGVPRDELPSAWREVVASAVRPDAVAYRYRRGLALEQAAMAVLVLPMLRPRAAGVLFTRDVGDAARDTVVVSITAGAADLLVSGRTDAVELSLQSIDDIPHSSPSLPAELVRPSELAFLRDAARRIEALFEFPQDVEWAIEDGGPVYFLQSRPLALAPTTAEEDPVLALPGDAPAPIIEGGHAACPGIGIGRVRKLAASDLPDSIPDGAVLVARNSLVELSRFLPACAALITEVGSPTSHMSILSREFAVPTLVGVAGAFDRLSDGQEVTVDASNRRVFVGAMPVQGAGKDVRGRINASAPLAASPLVRRLKELAEWVSPLHLTDPSAAEFAPEHCRSLHDLTRFVHESVYRTMFSFGEQVQQDLAEQLVLDLRLPLAVHLFDLGGGLKAPAAKVPPSEIASEPMQAFVQGLADSRIKWDRPRNISSRGFLSVVGQSMIGGPAGAEAMAEASFCVLSANYMNFAVRTGYHFSTIDTWCGRIENRNYIHFHFSGGGAGPERRERRQRFLTQILLRMNFQVRCRSDLLTARLDKFDRIATRSALEQLGRLTLCARQLDMLMETDSSAEYFASAFLANDFAHF